MGVERPLVEPTQGSDEPPGELDGVTGSAEGEGHTPSEVMEEPDRPTLGDAHVPQHGPGIGQASEADLGAASETLEAPEEETGQAMGVGPGIEAPDEVETTVAPLPGVEAAGVAEPVEEPLPGMLEASQDLDAHAETPAPEVALGSDAEALPGMEVDVGMEVERETAASPEPELDAERRFEAAMDALLDGGTTSDAAAPAEGATEPGWAPPPEVEIDAPIPDDAWVFEREPDLDPSDVSYEPVRTLEEELAEFGREVEEGRDDTIEVRETFEASVDFWARREPGWDGGVDTPTQEPGVTESPEEAMPPEPPVRVSPSVGAFTLGKRDPSERARRLARVLVSDMIMYNPERHQRALAAGTLESDFEEEIAKSWKEYVEQVGRDLAEATDYWRAALNDVLAGGRQVF